MIYPNFSERFTGLRLTNLITDIKKDKNYKTH